MRGALGQGKGQAVCGGPEDGPEGTGGRSQESGGKGFAELQ